MAANAVETDPVAARGRAGVRERRDRGPDSLAGRPRSRAACRHRHGSGPTRWSRGHHPARASAERAMSAIGLPPKLHPGRSALSAIAILIALVLAWRVVSSGIAA